MPISISLTPKLTTSTSLPSSFGLPIHRKKQCFPSQFTCKASDGRNSNQDRNHDPNKNASQFDRRDVLLGLGGLYSMAGLSSATPFASAEPIKAPDLTKCGVPEDLPAGVTAACCPPTKDSIVDYVLPTVRTRIRQPTFRLDKQTIAKYELAMKRMRELPDDDPRSFVQQAKIHCAYCNGAYDQVGHEETYIQIHNCWLFFPFHRWYLYFYERILGSLIGDPDFALPFWCWDSPAGYKIPSIFNDLKSTLFDPLRNQGHLNSIVDLDYSEAEVGTTSTTTAHQQNTVNLTVMYRQMVSNAKTPLLFFGEPYRAGGTPDPGAGSIENLPHGSIHTWCGDDRQKNLENMGNFYSAGRDPLFYSHHCNVDRMWNLWKQLPGEKRQDITDPDWLNTTFLFYDENKQLVRVKVADCRESRNLGYVYDDVNLMWLDSKPKRSTRVKAVIKKVLQGIIKPAHAAEEINLVSLSDFPLTLDKAVSVLVPRPKTTRSKKEKEEKEEVLVIQGIELDKSLAVKFDVLINDEDDEASTRGDKAELVGSFVNVPHSSNAKKKMKTIQRFGITELLETLDTEEDEFVVVTLIPRSAAGKVTIGGIKIELSAE